LTEKFKTDVLALAELAHRGGRNAAKGALPIAVFLAAKDEKLQRILAQAKRRLNDAAAANATP